MKKEQSSGAVVFRMIGDEPYYLLLHYPSSGKGSNDYWDFPKGHIEEGEEERETALREIEEETGLSDIRFVEGFKGNIHYFFQVKKQRISKTVSFFATETAEWQVRISEEHSGFVWLPYGKALRDLKYDNAKRILKEVHTFLRKKGVVKKKQSQPGGYRRKKQRP